jgi:hypothetical protein
VIRRRPGPTAAALVAQMRRRPRTTRGGRPVASKKAANAPVHGVRLPNGGWHLRIGLNLVTPNAKSGHPLAQHRERVDWTVAVQNALVIAVDVRSFEDYKLLAAPARKVPMRVTLTREVPSVRHYITDIDNLWFMAKRLVDALKANRLIYDDSMGWCERPRPQQRVSADHQHWTDLVIEPLDVAPEVARG